MKCLVMMELAALWVCWMMLDVGMLVCQYNDARALDGLEGALLLGFFFR